MCFQDVCKVLDRQLSAPRGHLEGGEGDSCDDAMASCMLALFCDEGQAVLGGNVANQHA